MTDNTGIFTAVTLIVALGFGGFVGWMAGYQNEENKLRPVEVAQNCAHYDMDTGHFTWGAKPMTIDQMNDQTISSWHLRSDDAPVPQTFDNIAVPPPAHKPIHVDAAICQLNSKTLKTLCKAAK